MKWQKKRPANEQAEPRALSAGQPGVDGEAKAKGWLPGFFLVAVTLMAYQPVWHAGFIWDDDSMVTNNPVLKSADGLSRLWFAAATPDYYPMTYSLLWLEWQIWASNPLGYHLVNVLLHAFSAVLLWRVLQRLNIPGALLASALFAVHPVNVESVAWIAESKNTLCMFLYLGALLFWLKFEDSGRGRWYGLALVAFTLALFSKTAVAPLPLVLLGMAWWRRGRLEWKDVRRVVPFLLMAAALCPVAVWFHSHRAIGQDVVRTDGFCSRLAGAGWAVWFYLYKAVLPLHLAFVYPRWQIDARSVLTYIPLVLLAAAFVLCWRCGWKALCFGLAYFVVMLLPILGFLNIYFMRYSLVADHWQYFAIIGPIALAAAVIRRPVVAAALLLALGALTWQQCGMYASAETLWQSTLRLNPNCWLAHNDLGLVLDEKGKVDEAIAQYQEALDIKADDAEAHYNLGVALAQKGRVDEAISQYEKALQLKEDYVDAHVNLGIVLDKRGREDEAVAHYQKALQINPDFAEAHNNLGIVLLQRGNVSEAIVHFQKALQIDPANPAMQNNLAWLLATCAEASLRDGSKAVQLARQANALTSGENPMILRTLAAALAETGRYAEAVGTARRALQLAETQSNAGLAGQLQAQLNHYQAGRPFRRPAQSH